MNTPIYITIDAFRSVMQQARITPPETIEANGKIQRFHVEGDNKGSKNGWYVLYPDFPPAGAFGCFKRNIRKTFSPDIHSNFVTARIEQSSRLDSIWRAVDRERERQERPESQTYVGLWKQSAPATDGCKYLLKKGVRSYGLRYHKGQLLIPVMNMAGELCGLQRIYPGDSGKGFFPGTKKAGHFYKIGADTSTILIAEGYATAAILHEVTGHTSIVAFDAGNLQSVAQVIRQHYPDAQIVLCADDDRYGEENTGLTCAANAAKDIGGLLAVPTFSDYSSKPTDFNDLCQLEGPEVVCLQIAAVLGGRS